MEFIYIAIGILLSLVFLVLLYRLGRVSKRKSGREPYASGHRFSFGRVSYKPSWLYYLCFFILWDIIVLFILFVAYHATIVVLLCGIILTVSMAAYPIGPYGGERK